jgi:hypothetical protein
MSKYRQGRRLFKPIIASLSDDLLHPGWLAAKKPTDHKTFGQCVHASMALWILLGGRRSMFHPYHVVDYDGERHLFLLCELTGQILDVTQAQYLGEEIPYFRATRYGYFCPRTNRSTRTVLSRVRRRLRQTPLDKD